MFFLSIYFSRPFSRLQCQLFLLSFIFVYICDSVLPEAAAHSSRQKSSHHRKVFLSPRLFKPRRRSNANCRLMPPRKTNTAFHEDVGRVGGGGRRLGVFRDGKGVGWTSSVPTPAQDEREFVERGRGDTKFFTPSSQPRRD